MKVLLIDPPAQSRPLVRDMAGGLGFDGGGSMSLPPLDLAILAARLLRTGHEARIIDAGAMRMAAERVLEEAKGWAPACVISAVSLPSLENDCLFLRRLREAVSGARIIAKTNIVFPPLLETITRSGGVDGCVWGECDLHIERIVAGESRSGTAYISEGRFFSEAVPPVADLDLVPFPARELLPNDRYRYPLLGGPVTTMQTSRGCPFPCAYYCPYPLVQGNVWRARGPESVLSELEEITRRHGISRVLFRDATFTFDKKRVLYICREMVRRELAVSWWCETRIDRLDGELIAAMHEAGCRGMNIGVETGDPELLRSTAKAGGASLGKLGEIRDSAAKAGMRLHFLMIVGLPGETRASLGKSYELIARLRPESMGTCLITPYPGTPLYAEARAKGWIESERWQDYGGHRPVMHTDQLSSRELAEAFAMLTKGFGLMRRADPVGRIKLMMLSARFRAWARAEVKR